MLSIITPTLNCAATLPATLASIRPLLDAGLAEHLVVDSGSTDGTVELAAASGATMLTWPRGNMYAAINEGMRHAKGEWLTYINGDDLLYSDAVVEILEQVADETDIVYGNIDYIDEVGRFLFPWRSASVKWIRPFMAYYNPFPQQGTLFRRSVYETNDGFDTAFRYSADYDFWVRAFDAGSSVQKYSKMSLAGFRLLAEQLSQSKKSEMAPEGISVRARLRARHSRVRNASMHRWAQVYRICSNLDSRLMRTLRGRGLDQR